MDPFKAYALDQFMALRGASLALKFKLGPFMALNSNNSRLISGQLIVLHVISSWPCSWLVQGSTLRQYTA